MSRTCRSRACRPYQAPNRTVPSLCEPTAWSARMQYDSAALEFLSFLRNHPLAYTDDVGAVMEEMATLLVKSASSMQHYMFVCMGPECVTANTPVCENFEKHTRTFQHSYVSALYRFSELPCAEAHILARDQVSVYDELQGRILAGQLLLLIVCLWLANSFMPNVPRIMLSYKSEQKPWLRVKSWVVRWWHNHSTPFASHDGAACFLLVGIFGILMFRLHLPGPSPLDAPELLSRYARVGNWVDICNAHFIGLGVNDHTVCKTIDKNRLPHVNPFMSKLCGEFGLQKCYSMLARMVPALQAIRVTCLSSWALAILVLLRFGSAVEHRWSFVYPTSLSVAAVCYSLLDCITVHLYEQHHSLASVWALLGLVVSVWFPEIKKTGWLPKWLICISLAPAYFYAGLAKLTRGSGASWLNGKALSYILTQLPGWFPSVTFFIASCPQFCMAASLGLLTFEVILSPLAILLPSTFSSIFLMAAASFHLFSLAIDRVNFILVLWIVLFAADPSSLQLWFRKDQQERSPHTETPEAGATEVRYGNGNDVKSATSSQSSVRGKWLTIFLGIFGMMIWAWPARALAYGYDPRWPVSTFAMYSSMAEYAG